MGAHGTLQEALDSVASFADADRQRQLDGAKGDHRRSEGSVKHSSSKKKHKKEKEKEIKRKSRKKVAGAPRFAH